MHIAAMGILFINLIYAQDRNKNDLDLDMVTKVVKNSKYFNEIYIKIIPEKNRENISSRIERYPNDSEKYYWVTTGYSNGTSYRPLVDLLVDSSTMEIYQLDVITEQITPISIWGNR